MVLQQWASCAHVLQKCCHNAQCSAVEMEKLLPGMSRLRREVTSLLKAEEAWRDTCRSETGPCCRAISVGWRTMLWAFTRLVSNP